MSWSAGVLREVLPNGLTILVAHMPATPAVAIVTRVQAGFFDEPDHWLGISHVLEHMVFKGTSTRGVGAIARETREAGGYINAATSYDYTTYYTVLPVRSWEAGLAIQADALQDPRFDPEELRREIAVILQEARRKLDTPSAVAHETLHQLLFDHHRIRRWRIGTPETLGRLTREDVVAYYRGRYVPSRTVVSIAGGMDPEQALVAARRHYQGWPAAEPVVDRSPAEPPRRERRVTTLRGDVRQADLMLGWRGVPALHGDAVPLDVAAAVLSAGRSSWLYRGLRETGLASAVGAWNYTPTEVGVFLLTISLDPGQLREALGRAWVEVARLREDGLDGETLERVRTQLRAGWARRFESAEGRAAELAGAEALGGVGLLDVEYERLVTLSAEEVRAAARRHLDPDSIAAVAYVPRAAQSELTLAELDQALRHLPGPGWPARRPNIQVRVPRRVTGEITAGVLHVALAGADLLLRRRVGAPLVALGVYRFRAASEVPEQAGIGVLSVRSALRGAGGLEAAALAEAFERIGGPAAASIGPDWFGFSVGVLREHLGTAAALLDLVLRDPTFPEDGVAVERELLAEDAAQVGDDMFRYPVQLAFRAAFGDSRYGLPLLGWPETVRRLAAADLVEWHRAQLGAGRTTVVAVGDLDLDQAARVLAAQFGDHSSGFEGGGGGAGEGRAPAQREAPTVAWSIPAVPRGERREVEVRDKNQTALAMLFPGPDRRSPDRFAAEIWAAVAGGMGGRLFEALRERGSLAYTVTAFPWQRRWAGALLTYIATTPEQEDEARAQMLRELERFVAEPPTEEEVRRAVRYVVGQAEVARQRTSALAGEIVDAWLQGNGLEELLDLEGPYVAVTPTAVRELAARVLRPDQRSEGIVRGSGGGRAD